MEDALVHKSFPSAVKAAPDGSYEFTISTEGVDRDGDIIRASGWDFSNYLKNPVVLYGHDYKGLPIGKATSIRTEGDSVVASVRFSEAHQLARDVKALVDEDILRTTSVGFMPTIEPKSLESKGFEFQGQELLEFSITPVPSNPEALRRAVAKGLVSSEVALELDKALDESPWDGSAAMSACAKSSNPAAAYRKVCAGKRDGDPSKQSSWALPHHKEPGAEANAAGVRNALARLGQTQGLTNAKAAKAHLEAHLNSKDASDLDPNDPAYEIVEAAAEGDLGQVRALVEHLSSQVAEAVKAAARSLQIADEADAHRSELERELDALKAIDAPADQLGASEPSAVKSVLSQADIARIAASAAKDYFETQVLGRVK